MPRRYFPIKGKEGKTTDTPWTEHELYAPDVVEKDGKYYLYAYIVDAKGCVAVSDRTGRPIYDAVPVSVQYTGSL